MGKATLEYDEALAIIKAGQEMLSKVPRADMPGFVPPAYARPRSTFYDEQRQRELAARKAIEEGRKVYHDGICPPR